MGGTRCDRNLGNPGLGINGLHFFVLECTKTDTESLFLSSLSSGRVLRVLWSLSAKWPAFSPLPPLLLLPPPPPAPPLGSSRGWRTPTRAPRARPRSTGSGAPGARRTSGRTGRRTDEQDLMDIQMDIIRRMDVIRRAQGPPSTGR